MLYAYLLYPLVLLLLRLLIHRPIRKATIEPFVSILVPAYNEADVIAAKIANAQTLDYPAEKLEVVIASDGSKDGTAEIAQGLSDGVHVRTLAYQENRGKIAVLNDGVRGVRGEICLFSDAAAILNREAIRALCENFADPAVGAVSGTYKVVKASEARLGKAEDVYWKYETFLKAQESALGYLIGGHGHILAIRTSLYPFPSPGMINDDYIIPLRILKRGYRVVYEPRAVAFEEAHEMGGFKRRIRVMAGNIEQLREIGELLWPPRWLPLFFFISHKVMRLLVPLAMLCLVLSNLLLLSSPLYARLALLQLCFYVIALLGGSQRLQPKLLRLPYYFCMINAAAFVAMYHVVSGRRRMAWK